MSLPPCTALPSAGCAKGLFILRNATQAVTGSKTPKNAPYNSAFADIGCRGMGANHRPNGNNASDALLFWLSLIMDISCNNQTACSIDAADGADKDFAKTSCGSPRPKANNCNTTSSNDLLKISGVGHLRNSANLHFGNKCTTTPSCVRPTRPFLCTAFAHVMAEVSSAPNCRPASKTRSFMTPLLMTNTMSSTVTEVSAMLVLKTTLRKPLGGSANTRC
mmetsp:Transcript_3800/g.14091  ORF Transcript_3800/g.14091 Transcript_3800/m.14091 type:complete len:220 (-) Transcript_3800:1226-1885(-)